MRNTPTGPYQAPMVRPTYTILEEAPWMNKRASQAPTASSIYSDDLDDAMPAMDMDMEASSCPPEHAHPRQHIMDAGPQVRQSRLPIFTQVRSMLHKPPLLSTPASYTSPYDGAFQARRYSPDRISRPMTNPSPVSVPRTVSPVSHVSVDGEYAPAPLSPNTRSLPTSAPLPKQVRRKAVNLSPSASENQPPLRRLSVSSQGSAETVMGEEPRSHFSWTTIATSVLPNRQSTDTTATRHMYGASSGENPHSRFSWSTVATNTTARTRADSRPSSPPPAIPDQYLQPQYRMPEPQSILSRRRPIQRVEVEDCSPPPRSTSHSPANISRNTTATAASISSTTKHMANSIRSASTAQTQPQGPGKRLPPPPPTTEPQSHIETLLAEERALALQRRNIERVVADLQMVEKASPMEVSFATVRAAKRKLEENFKTLEEVKKEEIELGIRIARARRKEGEGMEEGLWVRRVTG